MGDQVKELFSWARRRKILAAVFVTFTLVVGILIGSVVSGRVSAMKTFGFSGTNATPLTVPEPVPSSSSFAPVVNKVEPAVVNIATTQVLERKQTKRQRRAQPNENQDDPMQDFFDRFFDGRQDGPPQAERSLGSGVIVDKRGYILTNNHVVEQATKIQVQLNGETRDTRPKSSAWMKTRTWRSSRLKPTRTFPPQNWGIRMACKLATGCWRLAARLDCRPR